MNRIFSACLLSLLTFSALNAEDVEVKMKAATGFFYTGAAGKLIYQTPPVSGSSATFDFSQKSQAYFDSEIWVNVPYFPHIKLEYTNANLSGESDINVNIDLKINLYQLNINEDYQRDSRLDVNFYDAIAYYSYLEETPYPSVGVGFGMKTFKYVYDLDVYKSLTYQDYSGAKVPMLYLNTRYAIPVVDISLESDLKWYVFGDSTIYDWRAKADLMVDFDKEFSAGLEVGYRRMYFNIKGDDVDSVAGNASFNGVYFGLIGIYAKEQK